MDEDLSGKLRKAGRNRVVVSHAVGASNDGRYALLKAALFGGAIELYTVPAALAYWLIDRIAESVAAMCPGDTKIPSVSVPSNRIHKTPVARHPPKDSSHQSNRQSGHA